MISLPKNLSKDTYDFVDTMCISLSGKSMKETSAQRVLSGSSFVRDSITQEQFDAMIGRLEPKKLSVCGVNSCLNPPVSSPCFSSGKDDQRSHQPFTSLERLATNQM